MPYNIRWTYLLTPFFPWGEISVRGISGRMHWRSFRWSGCRNQSSQNLFIKLWYDCKRTDTNSRILYWESKSIVSSVLNFIYEIFKRTGYSVKLNTNKIAYFWHWFVKDLCQCLNKKWFTFSMINYVISNYYYKVSNLF